MWHGRFAGSSSWDEREYVNILGSDDREVLAVECCEFGLVVAFGECHETGIGSVERKTVVAGDEIGAAFPIVDGDVFDDDAQATI